MTVFRKVNGKVIRMTDKPDGPIEFPKGTKTYKIHSPTGSYREVDIDGLTKQLKKDAEDDRKVGRR